MIELWLSGLPHSTNKDDVYKGFFIPKGQIPHNLPSGMFLFTGLV